MTDIPRKMVDTALTSGVTPRLICPRIYRGRVVSPGPATNSVMITSSSEERLDDVIIARAPIIFAICKPIQNLRRTDADPGPALSSSHSPYTVIPVLSPLLSGMFIEKYLKVVMQLVYQVADVKIDLILT